MHATNHLLDRHRDQISANIWYLAIPKGAGPLQDLPFKFASSDNAAVIHQYPDGTIQAGIIAPDTPVEHIILYYPKSKSEADILTRLALSKLAPGGRLWLTGENKGGIKTVPKYFTALGLTARKIDAARHCSLFEVINDATLPETTPEIPVSHVQTDNGLTICSFPGVFGHSKLDQGSLLLLESLPRLSGKVLDFGCGSGLISATLLQRHPNINMHASDISYNALQATALTLKTNDLPNATLWHSDGFNQLDQRFNHIVSNPPFHEGTKTEYSVTETFIKQAKTRLANGGSLTIVANGFLKYEPVFEQTFGHCNTLAQAKGFKILQAFNR
ncbi:methyltransferase [Gynuella sp.]|uniref:methyltransferase n=1 Tax=Gynuella sp. TaxID=2969146 RepID=UPI003D0E1CC0